MSDYKNFHMTPHILSDLGLDPFSYRLYAEIKKIAGEDGVCFMSNQTLSEKCGIGLNTVIRSKIKLEQPFPKLNGKSLITIEKRYKKSGERDTDLIKIVNIWSIKTHDSINEEGQPCKNQPSLQNEVRQPWEGGGVNPGRVDRQPWEGYNEERINKNPYNKTTSTTLRTENVVVDVSKSESDLTPFLDLIPNLSSKQKQEIFDCSFLTFDQILDIVAMTLKAKVRDNVAYFFSFFNSPDRIKSERQKDPDKMNGRRKYLHEVFKESKSEAKQKEYSQKKKAEEEKSMMYVKRIDLAFNFNKRLKNLKNNDLQKYNIICHYGDILYDLQEGLSFPVGKNRITIVSLGDDNFEENVLAAIGDNYLLREIWFNVEIDETILANGSSHG